MANFQTSEKQVPEKSILDWSGRQTYLGNGFVYSYPETAAGATTETPVVLYNNPSGSGKSAFFWFRTQDTVTASGTARFRFYANATISATGTLATPENLRLVATAPSSVLVVTTGPTATVSGGVFVDGDDCLAFQPSKIPELVILDPGNTLLMTVITSATGNLIRTSHYWHEA